MRFNYIQILFFCIISLSCGGGEKNIHNQRNSEDSAAIAQEILESKKKLEDRALNEKATQILFTMPLSNMLKNI